MSNGRYCVVLLGTSPCDADPNTRCVMEVYGPFGSRDDCVAFANTMPEWTTPHFMMLTEPTEWPPYARSTQITEVLPDR
jgi:hypothetical protein